MLFRAVAAITLLMALMIFVLERVSRNDLFRIHDTQLLSSSAAQTPYNSIASNAPSLNLLEDLKLSIQRTEAEAQQLRAEHERRSVQTQRPTREPKSGQSKSDEESNSTVGAPPAPSALSAEHLEPRLGDGCYHIFIDGGANRGLHGRFLFEPHKYPKSHSTKLFDREFGKDRHNTDFCSFEIEPNPNKHPGLTKISEAYAAQGWRFHVIKAGASDRDGELSFYHVGDFGNSEVGFGVHPRGKKTRVTVPVFRFASWFERNIKQRKLPVPKGRYESGPKIVMKMDMEGSEYAVLPDLLLSGGFCDLDFLFMEWHNKFAPMPSSEHQVFRVTDDLIFKSVGEVKEAEQAVLTLSKNAKRCKARISVEDDESYFRDKDKPLP